jgi:hypothetical protein
MLMDDGGKQEGMPVNHVLPDGTTLVSATRLLNGEDGPSAQNHPDHGAA